MAYPRPLSPHLQVYKPQLTSVLSILHRMTGIILTIGAVAFVYWLVAVAASEESFLEAQSHFGSWYGQVALFGWSFSFFYHLSNGIRHLFWDAGHGFELSQAYQSGWAVVAASTALTAATWFFAITMGGGNG